MGVSSFFVYLGALFGFYIGTLERLVLLALSLDYLWTLREGEPKRNLSGKHPKHQA